LVFRGKYAGNVKKIAKGEKGLGGKTGDVKVN